VVEDRDGFSEFVRRSSRGLQRTAWLLTADWSTAEDLVQVSLAKTWARWDTIRRNEAADLYTRRVMMTTFLGWRRRRWVAEVPLGWLPDRAERGDPFDDADVRAALVAAVHRLPRRQRAVVVLRYFDDLSEQATAAALGCTIGTVKSQSSRALKTLRTMPGLSAAVTGEIV
jgi:RNA polymerase sigma-70 factor (sigma-E family)